MKKYFISLSILLLSQQIPFAQTTNISGTINSYIDVTALGPCANQIDVSNSSGFAAGNVVLIIQMKGATIDETNTAAFGTITGYNNSGKFERATILGITGNTIYFTKDLVNVYNAPAGKVQMILIPQYVDVNVNGLLSCQDWNGTTGGVLIFDASGNVDLNAGINVDGKGFVGGVNVQVCPNSCNFTTNENAYFYATGNYRGAQKGEGIAAVITTKELGRGAQANGGGGGNDHNNGGAGAGNYAIGGVGGNNAEPGAFNCKGSNNYGRAGLALAFGAGPGRIFLGGGGGAGQGNNGNTGGCPNNGNSGSGGDGGGLVIIKCNTFNGNGNIISARGNNGGNSAYDAAGGGGAGCVICLNVASYAAPAFSMNVAGGNGGNSDNGNSNRCYGPGGGGGGGVVFSTLGLPGSVSVNATGGNAGLVTFSTNGCNGSSTTATAGTAGATVISFVMPEGTVPPGGGCTPLPVEYVYFTGEYVDQENQLTWITATEINNSGFEVQHSLDLISFQSRGFVVGAGNSNSSQFYSFIDEDPSGGVHYYRLKQIDFDGNYKYSSIISVVVPDKDIMVYPNPTSGILTITGPDLENEEVTITNNLGSIVKIVTIRSGSVDISDLASGSYHLTIEQKYITTRKLITIIQ